MKSTTTLLTVLLVTAYSTVTAQWTKTNGPEGIYVTSFLTVNDSTLLCGTMAQGIYRSNDHGNIWTYTALDNIWVDCFVQDSQYVYAGCFGAGVYRSADKGLTWSPSSNIFPTAAVTCMLNAGGYIFAGSINDGMFRSADHGNTWVDVSQGLLTLSYIPAMTYSGNRLMVEVDNYIFYSLDFGNSWNVDQGTTAFYTIDNFFQHGDTVLASVGDIIFRTTDHGVIWSNPNIQSHNFIGFDHIGDTVYAGSTDGIYMTTDYGLTWNFTPSADLRHGARYHDDFIITGNNFLYAYQEIGVYKSQNKGGSWQQVPLSNFAVASTIDDAMIFDNGTVYTGTHTNGVYKTNDQGNTWTKIGTPNNLDTLSNEVIFDMLHWGQNIILAGGCGNGLFRSDNNGATWTHITNGLPPDNGTFTCIKTLEKCGPNILCAMVNGVFYSVDSGITWLPTNLTPNDVLQCGGFATRGNIACVGVIGNPPFPTGVYRSTNYGVTWTLADPILDIETMATGGNHTMYCGELFTSYVSYDDGQTWNGLGLGAAFSILAFDNYAFIGNNDGIFFSSNYGGSWTMMNQGMDPYPNNAVQGLTRDSFYVYAGTYRDGVWRRPLSDFGIVTGLNAQANEAENPISIYPNPSSGNIIISFGSEVKRTDALRIYNSIGEQVMSLPLSQYNIIRADISALADGIYTAIQQTAEGSIYKKFMLMSK